MVETLFRYNGDNGENNMMDDISYYKVIDKINGDKNMVLNTEITQGEYYLNEIKQKVNEELQATGRVYTDEATKYLVAGELTAKTNSEKKLVMDIVYLLTKVNILENMLENIIIEKGNLEYNNRFKQSTIDDSLAIEGDK